jgi:ribonuclease HI
MTILEAMRVAISRVWSNIVFESDSKVVVDVIKANAQRTSELCSKNSNIVFVKFIV